MLRQIFLFMCTLFSLVTFAGDYVTVKGRVTDFNGSPVDSCYVGIFNPDFSTAYSTYSDKDGYYRIASVAKGTYASKYAMRLK